MKIRYAAATTNGAVRKDNQDNFFAMGQSRPLETMEMNLQGFSDDIVQLYMVCDGMGGEECGEIASQIAVRAAGKYPYKKFFENPETVISEINGMVCEYQKKNHVNMGSTLTAVIIRDGRLKAVNVGDSRIYKLRNKKLMQFSQDHTEFQMMLSAGILKESDRKSNRASHTLVQYLGIPEEDMLLEPHIRLDSPSFGDRYLLCSDGVQEGLTEEMILQILEEHRDLKECCEALLQEALRMGSRDNITAMLLEVV